MANLVKFFHGLVDNLPSSLDPNNIYVTTDEGAIYAHGYKWYAGGSGYVNATVSVISGVLTVTFTRADGSEHAVGLLSGVSGAATTTTIVDGNQVQVDVELDDDSFLAINSGGLSVDIETLIPEIVSSTHTPNLIKVASDGLFADIKITLTDGILQLHSHNGTAYAAIGEAINIPLNTFLIAGKFFTSDDDPALVSWWQSEWGATPPEFENPSIVLVMKEDGGATPVYSTVVVPANSLFKPYNFEDTPTIDLDMDPNTSNVTAAVRFAGTQNNVVALSGANGLVANFTKQDSNSIALTVDTLGLAAAVIIDTEAAEDTQIELNVGENGISAQMVWNEF